MIASKDTTRRDRDRPGRANDHVRSRRSCTTCCGTCSRTRSTTRPSRHVRVEAERSDERVALAVLDTGPGHPCRRSDAGLRTLLSRGQVARRATRRHRDRLAIVKHLVELLGGTVTAGNRPEGGAAFTVQLPQGIRQPDVQRRDVATSSTHMRTRFCPTARSSRPDRRRAYCSDPVGQHPVVAGRDQRRRRDRQDPRPDDPAGDAPAHGR